MQIDAFRTLLDYHYWARGRVLVAAADLTPEQWTRDLRSSFPSVRDTLVHVFSSEWVWYSRWQGQSPSVHLSSQEFSDVEVLRQRWREQEVNVRRFVDDLGDSGVTRVLEYRALSGQPASSPFWQIVEHLVNHASYHRGQVTTLIRQLGGRPPENLDMITFYRAQPTAGPSTRWLLRQRCSMLCALGSSGLESSDSAVTKVVEVGGAPRMTRNPTRPTNARVLQQATATLLRGIALPAYI